MSLSVMGVGFIGSRYCELYPDATPEPRVRLYPTHEDILWMRSTTTNYSPQSGDLHLDIDTNLTHCMEVLRAWEQTHKGGVFNVVSSWFVFGSAAGTDAEHPARETDPCDPNGFYAITALAREKLVRSYCETIGRQYRILRLCNVIGNDPRAGKQKNALVMMLGKIKRGEDVQVYSGDAYRSVMHVDDVCAAIHLCLERAPINEIVNIGQPSARIWDLVHHAIAVTGSKSRVTLVAPPRFHQIVQTDSFHMATDKLRSLGFTPSMDPYQAVERVLANL